MSKPEHWTEAEYDRHLEAIADAAAADAKAEECDRQYATLIAQRDALLAAAEDFIETIDNISDYTEKGRILRRALNNRAGEMLRAAIAAAKETR